MPTPPVVPTATGPIPGAGSREPGPATHAIDTSDKPTHFDQPLTAIQWPEQVAGFLPEHRGARSSALSMMPESWRNTLPSGPLGQQLLHGRREVDTADRIARELARQRASEELFAQPRPTVAIGRYLLLERLGSGGMGVVHAAYDPELDRKVALKILRTDLAGDDAHARMLREARAMAKLTHPNVVAVYDVGTIAQADRPAVFIAMEYVDGVTLSTWLSAERRRVADIVAVLIEAGHGLAAAHERGLVHRDFKPDNVMIGHDGRVRVMDFGLARAATGITITSSDDDIHTIPGPSLVQTGNAAGTPAYMAPEQFGNDAVGPACDQFGFCVTLWEALHGRRPFGGRSVPQLWAALREGRPLPASSPREVPSWLRDAMTRGLAFETADRWPTMDDLLRALERGRSRARLRRIAAAAGVIAIAGASLLGLRALEQRDAIAACDRAGAQELWPARSEAVRTAILGTSLPSAETTLARVEPWLDAWSTAWQRVRSEACVQHDIEHTMSTTHYRRARGCLDVQAAAIAATIDELEAGGRDAVYRGAKATTRVFDPRECVDPLRLERGAWPEDDDWDAVLELRRRLAALGARDSVSESDDTIEETRAIVDAARELGFTPLVAEAQIRLGGVLSNAADYPAAEAELRDAFFAAGRTGADELALHAAAHLASVVAVRQARPDEGSEWVRHGEMLLDRVGGDSPAAAAMLLVVRGDVLAQRAEYDEALALYRRVLELREAELTPDHPDIAETLNVIANVQVHRGHPREAEAIYEQALAMTGRALGPEHPDVAHVLNNLANVLANRDAYDEAEPLYARAIAIRERALGPDHPLVAAALGNLAALSYSRRYFAAALPLYRRALAIKEASLGEQHPDLALTVLGICNTQRSLGALEEASVACDRALDLAERGGEHRIVIATLRGLASLQSARGDSERALDTATRALAALEHAVGPDHPDVATMLHNLAGLHVARGDEAGALALRERALAIREKAFGQDDVEVAGSLEWVAESHRALGRHELAEQLYERALAIRERTHGPVDRGVADALTALGEIAITRGRSEVGIARFERALAILHEVDAPASDRAYTELALAQALPATDRARARDLARTAADSWRSAGDAEWLAKAEAFLAR